MIHFRITPIVSHFAAWLLFVTLPLLFMGQGRPLEELQEMVLWPYLQFCVLYIFIFYIHAYLLIPRFFLRERYFIYWIGLFLLLGMVFVVKPFDKLMSQNRPGERPPHHSGMPPGDPGLPGRSGPGHYPPPPDGHGKDTDRGQGNDFDITSLFVFLMVTGLGTALQSLRRLQNAERRAVLAEAEKASAELAFLKAQVNPHFLYNTLNNIYTLAVTGHPNAADSILKLSKIMRYVTDESAADFVPLEAEVACISDYIALQQLRMGSKTTLNYRVRGELSGKRIAPLIFMNFVENVFKYGLSNHVQGQIEIYITIVSGKIIFETENRVFGHKAAEMRKGTGIENSKRRLDHLYPGKYKLDIEERGSRYHVRLEIPE